MSSHYTSFREQWRFNFQGVAMNFLKILVSSALVLASFGVGAQSLKPGLWETSNKIQMGAAMDKEMAQMQQQMASMPPEQRKMMTDMMAKQGVGMGAGAAPGTTSVRICMTKEMAERNEIPAGQGDCKSTVSPRSGNTMKFSFRCVNPPSSGEGEISFLSPEAYTTKMTVSTTTQGKPEKMSMEGSSKWLSADCGAVKPMSATKK